MADASHDPVLVCIAQDCQIFLFDRVGSKFPRQGWAWFHASARIVSKDDTALPLGDLGFVVAWRIAYEFSVKAPDWLPQNEWSSSDQTAPTRNHDCYQELLPEIITN
jgi:hypothetical protein